MPVGVRHVRAVIDLAPQRAWPLEVLVTILEGCVTSAEAIDRYRQVRGLTEDTDPATGILADRLRSGRRAVVVSAIKGCHELTSTGKRGAITYRKSGKRHGSKTGVTTAEILTFLSTWDKDKKPTLRDVFNHFKKKWNRRLLISMHDREHSNHDVPKNEKVRRTACAMIRYTIIEQAQWVIEKPKPLDHAIVVPARARAEFKFVQRAAKYLHENTE